MKIFDKEFKDTIKEIFWEGRTNMGIVWLMFLLGILFGWVLGL